MIKILRKKKMGIRASLFIIRKHFKPAYICFDDMAVSLKECIRIDRILSDIYQKL